MYLEFDWTFNVYRPRFHQRFIDVRGERSWETMADAKAALAAVNLRVGAKTDSRTWSIELIEGVAA